MLVCVIILTRIREFGTEKMHLKMSSAEVVCCKTLPNITDQLGIEGNSVDPEQAAPIGAV